MVGFDRELGAREAQMHALAADPDTTPFHASPGACDSGRRRRLLAESVCYRTLRTSSALRKFLHHANEAVAHAGTARIAADASECV